MLDTGLRPDTTPPSVAFTFPALSGFTQNGTFTFRGVAADDVALASVEVDGQSVTSSDGFATWSITVDTADGGGVFEVVATDTSGNEARATRSIVLHNDLANPRGFHFDPISDDLHYIDGGSLRIAPSQFPDPAQDVALDSASTRREAVLAGGCFWCTEAVFKEVRGVLDVESGYSNGQATVPSYEQVCTGRTGCAEVVKLVHDPAQVRVVHPFPLGAEGFALPEPLAHDLTPAG